MFSALALLQHARSLQGLGECPEVKTADGNTYREPWAVERAPSVVELFDWYNEAELQVDRLRNDPRVNQAELDELVRRWVGAPNRYRASVLDRLGAATLARDVAQKALCLFHDANHGTDTAKTIPLPKPWPSEGTPVDDWVKEQKRKAEGWALLGGFALLVYLATRDNR